MGAFLIRIFIRNHENTEDPEVRKQYGRLAGIVGIVSNIFLCIIKLLIGLFSASIAIIADGINNLADASSSVITLIGFKMAALPEDEDHPYGHARIEYLAGLFVSVFIIIIGIQLMRSSIGKIIHPEPADFSYITIAVLVLAILIKLWQTGFNLTAGKRIDSVTLLATAADSRNDVISTSAVLTSVLICRFTGLQTDGIMGCLVALFIIWSGIQFVRETSSPLLGEAPDEELVKSIISIVEKEPDVIGIHDLMVHNYGPGKIFASMHIEVDASGDLMKSHDMIDNIERRVKELLNIEFVVHMDPVVTNDPLITEMKSLISNALKQFDGVENIHDFRIVPGHTHTNIIFDAVLSPGCRFTEKEIQEAADKAAKNVGSDYYVVITFDRAYTRL